MFPKKKESRMVLKKPALPAPKVALPAPKKAAALPPPAAKKVAAPAPAAEATGDYRKARKYTAASLLSLFTSKPVGELRARISKTPEGLPGLSLKEAIGYLQAIESDIPDWKAKRGPTPDGKPRRKGRPPKNAPAAVLPPPKTDAAATLAKAAAGGLIPKKAAPLPPPPAKKLTLVKK
jgi:hypothetical protein